MSNAIMYITTNGYGSSFTKLTIKTDKLEKKSINEYGNFKITNEIAFYSHLLDRKYTWKIPDLYGLTPTSILMKYYRNYHPLYIFFSNLDVIKQDDLLLRVMDALHTLHSFETIHMTKCAFKAQLELETFDKIVTRVLDVKGILDQYKYITHVNSIKLLTYEEILGRINTYMNTYVDTLTQYTFCIIHGDCQFSNILYNQTTDDIVFIDPRGYFGTTPVYGLKEYDIAKVYFALSGYDYFDKLDVKCLNINDTDMIIDRFSINLDCLNKIDIVSVLVISIWLGNSHAFKANHMKTAMSHFYARYLGTLLFANK
jgi:hypothetical protein